jgi:hypothetical protein
VLSLPDPNLRRGRSEAVLVQVKQEILVKDYLIIK